MEKILEGRFGLRRELGRGGFGAVYEAEVLAPPGGALVALKILVPPPDEAEEFEARFLREVRNAQRLEHPNAVRVFDFGALPDGRLWYSMELCPGRSLRDVLDAEGALEPVRAVRIARQALAALGAAYAIGMVHRDVKPGNIQVARGPDGHERAKLLDFGLAKIGGGRRSQELTTDGLVFGTPEYMSPEQLMGKPLDGRADIWSLAIVLYELLLGRRPFASADHKDLSRMVLFESPFDLAAATGGRVGAALAAVVRKGLEKRVEDRFATAEAMAEALLAAEPRAAPPRAEAMPGALGGRYVLRRLLHEGRRGALHEGWDLELGRPVAVDVLEVRGAVPDDDLRRYLRGVNALAGIVHPNVVRFLDAGATPAGKPFFVMEWVPGAPLAEFLEERGAVPLPEAADALRQVLAGLEAAHAAGIVHRDVTPRHILIVPTDDGAVAKLTGFGLAKSATGEDGTVTRWSPPAGTPPYMSPEQLRGQPLDARADLWSAGVVLFEMLAGRRPFPGEGATEVARAVLGGPAPALPGPAGPVVARALAARREDRFSSAREFGEALAELRP